MNPEVVIIGAGVAGLTMAAALSAKGVSSLLIEQGLYPGGHAANLSCKSTKACAKCNACLVEESLTELAAARNYRLVRQTVVSSCQSENGRFQLKLSHAPAFLNTEKCVDCGLCLEVCPAKDRAIRRSPTAIIGPRFVLSAEECLFLQGRDCRACLEVCPAGAIDFSASAWEEEVETRAVVLAPGFTPFDPREKPRFGYGRLPGVVTAMEADRQLRSRGRLQRPSDGSWPSRVAFIQCVGSRDKSIGRDYCSRVCCGYALGMAGLIRHRRPETAVSLFYMDLQNFGRDFDRYYQEIKGEIELIHGVPGEITAGPDRALAVPFLNEATGQTETRMFDLVILSIGLGPPGPGLASIFGLEPGRDGFIAAKPGTGLFIAGAAEGPMSVAEARARARGVAGEVFFFLEKGK